MKFTIKYLASSGRILTEQIMYLEEESRESAIKTFRIIKPHAVLLEVTNEAL